MKIDHYKNKKRGKNSQGKKQHKNYKSGNRSIDPNYNSLRMQKPVSLCGLEFTKTFETSKNL